MSRSKATAFVFAMLLSACRSALSQQPSPEWKCDLLKSNKTKVRLTADLSRQYTIREARPNAVDHLRGDHDVVVEVAVDLSGTVQCARIKSGNPMLFASSLQASKGWKYQQYLLDGDPVVFFTEINFHFHDGKPQGKFFGSRNRANLQ